MLGDVLLITEKHHKAARQIVDRLEKIEAGKFVIAIGGESGSGKSELAHVVARKLKAENKLTKILHIDNYYLTTPQERTSWRQEHGIESIGWTEYNWTLINQHIEDFKAGKMAELPCIDLLTDQIDTLITDFADIRFLIIEGLYPLKAEADMRIFIDLTYHETKKAQLLRGKEPQNEYRLQVLHREHEVAQSLRPMADFIVTKDFDLIKSLDMLIPTGDIDFLAIGEILIDFISLEETDSLEDAYTFRKYLGGSPANIAVNIAKLGGSSTIIAKTGIGTFGTFLKTELNRAGVNTDYLIMDHRVHTSFIFISRTSGTPDFEASRNGDYKLTPSEVDEQAIHRAKVIHASTFSLSREPMRSAVKKAFTLARDQGKIISLDPNYSPQIWPDHKEAVDVVREMMALTTITKPSLDDSHRLFGKGKTPQEYINLFHEMGPSTVVFTMGADGILLSDDRKITHIPARPIQVVDATGAGDSFWAGFITALLDGNSLQRCGLFAREIAERKLSTVGPLPDDIDRLDIYAQLEE